MKYTTLITGLGIIMLVMIGVVSTQFNVFQSFTNNTFVFHKDLKDQKDFTKLFNNKEVTNSGIVSDLVTGVHHVSPENMETCGFYFEEMICDRNLVLTGLPEYDSFLWTNARGETIGTQESVTITEAGMYVLTARDDVGRHIVENWKVIPCEGCVSDLESVSVNAVLCDPKYVKSLYSEPIVSVYDSGIERL